MLKKEQCKESN